MNEPPVVVASGILVLVHEHGTALKRKLCLMREPHTMHANCIHFAAIRSRPTPKNRHHPHMVVANIEHLIWLAVVWTRFFFALSLDSICFPLDGCCVLGRSVRPISMCHCSVAHTHRSMVHPMNNSTALAHTQLSKYPVDLFALPSTYALSP